MKIGPRRTRRQPLYYKDTKKDTKIGPTPCVVQGHQDSPYTRMNASYQNVEETE